MAACDCGLEAQSAWLSTLEAFYHARTGSESGILPTTGPPHGGRALPRMRGCHGQTTPHHGASTVPASHHGLLGSWGYRRGARGLHSSPRGPLHPGSAGLGSPQCGHSVPVRGQLRFLHRTQGDLHPQEALGLLQGSLAIDPESGRLGRAWSA